MSRGQSIEKTTLEDQEAIVTTESDQISNNSDTFPGVSRELFTHQTYTNEKLGPAALAEDLGDAGKSGCTIYIQHKILGTVTHRTTRFFLTQMAIGLSERSQILETFGSSNVSFFGPKTKVYNFGGAVVD